METEGNAIRFIASIHPEHEVFKGHFPHQPVVPGVFTLQMIKECFEIAQNKKYRYNELNNCKFIRPIFPEPKEDLTIECEYESSDFILLKATVQAKNQVCLTLKAHLEEL